MKNNKTIILLLIILLIFLITDINPLNYLTTPQYQFSNFNGVAESFNFNGQGSEVSFNAKTTSFTTDSIIFRSVKNVTIEKYTGEELIKKSSVIEVKFNYSPYKPIILFDADIDIQFTNISMNLDNTINNNSIYISGYLIPKFIEPKGGNALIQNIGVESLFVNGKNNSDFIKVSFDMDNSSSIWTSSGAFSLRADGASGITVISNSFSKLSLFHSDGTLNLDDRLFNIKKTDWLDIAISQQNNSRFKVDDSEVTAYGFTNSTKLNGKDIKLSYLFYWFREQPEKISVLAVIIALFLTAWSSYSTHRLVSMEVNKKKHEEQKFLNILLAEFEENKILLSDLKNAIDNIIKDRTTIYNFEFICFREDGFNSFKNQGGFEYVSIEIYTKIVEYYSLQYRISKKVDNSSDKKTSLLVIYIRDEGAMNDIEALEANNDAIRKELMNEILELKNSPV